ncbi:unnamed protein product [Moneuplotes crassus]|uniref:Uncharacterized protein n=1 Tax=Euplotes crassus TaxID=5936 RepID=A0AAD1XNC3_EUPCR|nr:unnamed protein product [Moneuplotes crassus]
MLCWINCLAYAIGYFVIGLVAVKFGFYVQRTFFRKGYDVHERYGKDSWILITGATAGIGLALAKYSAKVKGLNVVLLGRNQEKLDAAEKEVKAANPKIKTKTYKFDFTKNSGHESYLKISEDLKDLDISMLVNNAGVQEMRPILTLEEEAMENLTLLNINGLSLLTLIFAKRFAKRDKRSAIVNVASQAGYAPLPGNAPYGASKAFVRSLTKAVGYELRDKIDMLCFSPGFVTTDLCCFKEGPDVVSPDDCAPCIFRDLGYETENQPCSIHEFVVFIVPPILLINENLPNLMLDPLTKDEFNRMEEIRSKENKKDS